MWNYILNLFNNINNSNLDQGFLVGTFLVSFIISKVIFDYTNKQSNFILTQDLTKIKKDYFFNFFYESSYSKGDFLYNNPIFYNIPIGKGLNHRLNIPYPEYRFQMPYDFISENEKLFKFLDYCNLVSLKLPEYSNEYSILKHETILLTLLRLDSFTTESFTKWFKLDVPIYIPPINSAALIQKGYWKYGTQASDYILEPSIDFIYYFSFFIFVLMFFFLYKFIYKSIYKSFFCLNKI